ncbi:hypothetical protein [Candidatus Chlamydia corallus]|uniref:hypothetical protein n=1 Tax=Candidatus Chlamydia corallus TaxID=2038470 RepID=UPI000C2FC546|nr:hypothetical protein [Candidatus Chlamydia corallus]
MSFTYFLALPIDRLMQEQFLGSPKRWASLLDSPLYLTLIAYHNTPYLAKKLSDFPWTLEKWQKMVLHVSSLLKSIFLCSDLSSLRLLACSKFEMLTLNDLYLPTQNI